MRTKTAKTAKGEERVRWLVEIPAKTRKQLRALREKHHLPMWLILECAIDTFGQFASESGMWDKVFKTLYSEPEQQEKLVELYEDAIGELPEGELDFRASLACKWIHRIPGDD